MLVTGATALLAYRGVAGALESEFERRLTRIATTAAGQIDAADLGDARLHEEGGGYASLQLQIASLRAAADVANASLVDTSRVTLVEALARAEAEGQTTPLDTLAPAALGAALAGRAAVSPPFFDQKVAMRAACAPVLDERGRVAGVVAIEARAGYLPVIADLRRTLTLIALVSLLAIAVFGALFVGRAGSAARLERQLSRSENLAAMGRLTATLAHEIKNPLAVIRGSAQRLGRLDPEARRMADFVIEESDRLSNTVARYLRFARGEPAVGDTGDALAALDQTLDLLQGEFAARKVELARSGGRPAAAPVALDNESLKQVYLNLILNALDALADGGRLAVTTSEPRGRIEVAIADNGPGMSPETLRRIGSPFYTTRAQGTGLGLFLTRRLVQSAGGELKIESQVGRGTTCTLLWPRSRG